jgi:hypothetical protein
VTDPLIARRSAVAAAAPFVADHALQQGAEFIRSSDAAHLLKPCRLDIGDLLHRPADHSPAQRREADQLGAAIGGIGHALDKAGRLEANHQLAHGLMRHLRAGCTSDSAV